jgi:hypothetical protein
MGLTRSAVSQLSSRRTAVAPLSGSPGANERATATPEQLSALYRTLIDADDRGDAAALARLGWILFTMACGVHQAHREAISLLDELRAAARATAAGQGSPASLAILRHVLARHGWLPPRDATPLQVLATPPNGRGFAR